jgi:Putative DNA-binding domain
MVSAGRLTGQSRTARRVLAGCTGHGAPRPYGSGGCCAPASAGRRSLARMTHGSRTRFPRVDALLDARLDTYMNPNAFGRLIDEEVAEFDQLEFKGQMYAATEDGRCELAKDVCAFANATGGVLICGIAEVKGTASKLMPFEVSDSDVRHVNGVVAQRVAPMPAVDVFTVADSGTGYLVISVPASPWAPHAVIAPNEDRLLFPVRNGSQTRYLREPELADRYRNRFAAAGGQVGRLDEVRQDAVGQLSFDHPWLYLAVVPNTRTLGSVGINSVNDTTEWLRNDVWRSPCGNPWIDAAREVGVRRTISANRPDGGGPSRHDYAEFHADGCGFAAVQLRQPTTNQYGNPVTEWTVNETTIIDVAVALTGMLARHALRQGTTGEAIAEFGLISAGTQFAAPMALVQDRFHGVVQPSTERRLMSVPPSRHTFDLDSAANDASGLLLTARMLATDTVQAFGLPEVLHIDDEGRARVRYFGSCQNAVRQWADGHGAELSEATSVE